MASYHSGMCCLGVAAVFVVSGIFLGLPITGVLAPKVSPNKIKSSPSRTLAASPPTFSISCGCSFQPGALDLAEVEVALQPSPANRVPSWVDLVSRIVSKRLPLLAASPIFHHHQSTLPRHLPCSQGSCRSKLWPTTSSDAGSTTSPSLEIQLRASSPTSDIVNPLNLRSPGMIFLLSSFVPPSADVMWGPSIRVYAPLVHLRPPHRRARHHQHRWCFCCAYPIFGPCCHLVFFRGPFCKICCLKYIVCSCKKNHLPIIFSLTRNRHRHQPPVIQLYFSLKINQHQSLATSQVQLVWKIRRLIKYYSS